MIRSLTILLLLFCIIPYLTAQEHEPSDDGPTGLVKLNSELSYLMLEHNEELRKLNIWMDARQDGLIQPGNMYLGASLIGIMDYQASNTENKFAYLMRHPTGNNQRTKVVSEAALHSASFSVGGSVNNWLSVYAELLYDPEQSFGAGTTTALTRNQVQLRKGFVMVGDLEKSPVYFALGKMDGNFGLMGSVSPFTNSTMWHAFGTLAYGATLGFEKSGFNASIMLIQGGAQFRAAHTPVDNTVVPSKLNNLGLDANYTAELADQAKLKVGISYQKGTAYCQSFPVQHFLPCEESNSAMAYYGKLDYKGLTLKGSFAKTADTWPGTFNPNPPLNEFEASKVSSLDIGAKYRFKPIGDIRMAVSGEFSNFVAGADGSPWERQNQIVIGLSGQVKGASKLFLEVFRTMGYAPLNFISGGNMDDLGVTHSDSEARSTGIVVGGMIVI